MTGDGFFEGHRVARLLAVAVPAAIFLVWWGVRGDRGEVVSIELVDGVVVEQSGKTCLIRTLAGEDTRLLCPKNTARGSTLRLQRMHHESGELRFALAPTGAAAP